LGDAAQPRAEEPTSPNSTVTQVSTRLLASPREGMWRSTLPPLQGAEPVTSARIGRIHPDRAGRWASSSIFRTVFQLRKVLVVSSFESKYCAVSLLFPTPLGHRR